MSGNKHSWKLPTEVQIRQVGTSYSVYNSSVKPPKNYHGDGKGMILSLRSANVVLVSGTIIANRGKSGLCWGSSRVCNSKALVGALGTKCEMILQHGETIVARSTVLVTSSTIPYNSSIVLEDGNNSISNEVKKEQPAPVSLLTQQEIMETLTSKETLHAPKTCETKGCGKDCDRGLAYCPDCIRKDLINMEEYQDREAKRQKRDRYIASLLSP